MSDDCSIAQSIPADYMCKATSLVRFANEATLIRFDVIYIIFSSIFTREMERIFLQLSKPAEDVYFLMRRFTRNVFSNAKSPFK